MLEEGRLNRSSCTGLTRMCLKLESVLLLCICFLHIVLATSLWSSGLSSDLSVLRKLLLALLCQDSSGLLTTVMSLCLLLNWPRGRRCCWGGLVGWICGWRESEGLRIVFVFEQLQLCKEDLSSITLLWYDWFLVCMFSTTDEDLLLARAAFLDCWELFSNFLCWKTNLSAILLSGQSTFLHLWCVWTLSLVVNKLLSSTLSLLIGARMWSVRISCITVAHLWTHRHVSHRSCYSM